MNYTAEITIMPREGLLDPQGKAVTGAMHNLHIEGIQDVRMGKHIRMSLEAKSETEAREKVEAACKNLLANMIMENYSYSLSKN